MENLLEDFIINYKQYNSVFLVEFLERAIQNPLVLTENISIEINGIDTSKSLADVLKWCMVNPQPKDKLNNVIDLMVSSWIRAKFMELVEQ